MLMSIFTANREIMKRSTALLVVTAAFLTFGTSVASAQSLAERRAIAEYQENQFKDLQAEIEAAAGYALPLNVEWDKLALPGQASNYSNEGFFTNIFFRPLILALQDVASDDMGKAALRDGLQEVNVTYDSDTAPASAYERGVTLEEGVLTINFAPWSNVAHVDERKAAILKVLEENL